MHWTKEKYHETEKVPKKGKIPSNPRLRIVNTQWLRTVEIVKRAKIINLHKHSVIFVNISSKNHKSMCLTT